MPKKRSLCSASVSKRCRKRRREELETSSRAYQRDLDCTGLESEEDDDNATRMAGENVRDQADSRHSGEIDVGLVSRAGSFDLNNHLQTLNTAGSRCFNGSAQGENTYGLELEADDDLDHGEGTSEGEQNICRVYHEPDPVYVGSLNANECIKCTFCKALRIKGEKSTFCCGNGAFTNLSLPSIPPEEIRLLYKNAHFLNNIRSYNNIFALASIGCQEVRAQGFSPVLKIHGKVHHYIGPLIPANEEAPKYAQLYFYDPETELSNRGALHDGLQIGVIQTLQDCLHAVNPHIRAIKSVSDLSSDVKNYHVVLKTDGSKTTALPQSTEVAGLISQKTSGNVDVVFETRGGHQRRINELHKLYDPLHYILLLPYGECGYHLGMMDGRGKKISISKHARYLLQIREDCQLGNYFIRSRRLTQQYVIDQFTKHEVFRMSWYRSHQKEIRAEKYSGLIDSNTSTDNINPGKRIILPPSHYGSPRWYNECFQDSMAIVRKYGKPDLFVTFTCNPKWPEITNSLAPNEVASDRPDITIRIFNLRYERLRKLLMKDQILGRVVAFVAMKEDQKRGLPHVHILLFLANESKPRCPEDVDRIISAEIPDKTHPKLLKIVTSHHIHGPCGEINKNARCMIDKDQKCAVTKCSKNFPKAFRNEGTELSESGYPMYQRRDELHGGQITYRTINGRTFTIDNRWVVPYSPHLSYLMDAHVNVEIVTTVGSVKYIFKYICKGSDKALYSIQETEPEAIDEISFFTSARFVSASEAFWRIYEFDIYKRKPAVQKLSVHLPNEQVVIFDEQNVQQKIDEGPPETTLTAYFNLNKEDHQARNILYPDICQYYRFSGKKWIKRKRNETEEKRGTSNHGCADNSSRLSDMVGRIPIINLTPKQSELYHLRMLLHHIPGATSFEDLRMVHGEGLPTFKATCLKIGLLSSDDELDFAMNEVATTRFGKALRDLFTTLLVYGECSDPVAFWERHKDQLVDDIRHQNGRQNALDTDYNTVLLEIQKSLDAFDLDIEKDYGLPLPEMTNEAQALHEEEVEYDMRTLSEMSKEYVAKMTEDQLYVYEKVMHSINEDMGTCFALNAAGGTGKTFVITAILATVRSRNEIAMATAISGIAATLLPQGRTTHSALKVPIDIDESSVCGITPTSSLAGTLRKCKVLIIDEVTMGHRHIYEAIDRTLQDITQRKQLFGGITVVLSGDWRQILPVVRHGGEADIMSATLKYSEIWNKTVKLSLTKNMRLLCQSPENEEFSQYLLDVGEGNIDSVERERPNRIPIPQKMQLEENSLQELCKFVFGDLDHHYDSAEWMCSRGIMSSTNKEADEVNDYVTKLHPGEAHDKYSADSLNDDGFESQYPNEYLNSITPTGMPPHKLTLKNKLPAMLLRNLDPKHGHCNGTRYIINQIHQHIIETTVATGPYVGAKKFIPRISMVSSDKELPFRMKRVQFPLRVCFGMTLNKGQGQSFRKVGLYLKRDVFSHGQLYVGLSRVQDVNSIKVLPIHENEQIMKNVVYKSIVCE